MARFNINSSQEPSWRDNFFEGVPSPAGGLLILMPLIYELTNLDIGFNIKNEATGDEWHKAGIENGGESIEDPPGIRQYDEIKIYLAYLRDPSGNKLCALKRL